MAFSPWTATWDPATTGGAGAPMTANIDWNRYAPGASGFREAPGSYYMDPSGSVHFGSQSGPTIGGKVMTAAEAGAPPGQPGQPGQANPPAVPGSPYTVPRYTGTDTGGYGQWLRALQDYRAPPPVAGTTDPAGSERSQFNDMMQSTRGRHLLSPYMQALLEGQLNQAQAGYDISTALSGQPMAPQEGTGAQMSFGQYMQDRLMNQGNAGQGLSGFGSYQSGLPYVRQLPELIAAGAADQEYQGGVNGSPRLSAQETARLHDFYNTSAGRARLNADLRAGVAGPFASQRQDELADILSPTNPNNAGDPFLRQLREWTRAAYGR